MITTIFTKLINKLSEYNLLRLQVFISFLLFLIVPVIYLFTDGAYQELIALVLIVSTAYFLKKENISKFYLTNLFMLNFGYHCTAFLVSPTVLAFDNSLRSLMLNLTEILIPLVVILLLNRFCKLLFSSSPLNFVISELNKIVLLISSIALLHEFLKIFFTTDNLLILFICFELSAVPLFFTIWTWGSRSQRIRAGKYLFFFTVLGSIPFLLGILTIVSLDLSLSMSALINHQFELELEKQLWILFFCPVAIKAPAIPFTVWLTEAHVEAPTEGSMLLAGIILKLGSFFLFQFVFPAFPSASEMYIPYAYAYFGVSFLFTCALSVNVVDMKRYIAYSSISHMNYVLVCALVQGPESYYGAYFTFFAHGITSCGLFLCAGMLYGMYHTRLMMAITGIWTLSPVFSICLVILTFANMGVPGMANFIGEMYASLGLSVGTSISTLMFFILTFVLTTTTSIISLIQGLMGPSPDICIENKNGGSMRVFLDPVELTVLIILTALSAYFGLGF